MLARFARWSSFFSEETGSMARFVVHLSSMREEREGANSVVVVMTDVTEAALLQAKLAAYRKDGGASVNWCPAWLMKSTIRCRAIIGFTDLLLGIPSCRNLPGSTGRHTARGRADPADRPKYVAVRQGKCPAARARASECGPPATLKLRSYGLSNRMWRSWNVLAENLSGSSSPIRISSSKVF